MSDANCVASRLTPREQALLRRIVESGSVSTFTREDSIAVTQLINAGLVDVRKVFVPSKHGIAALRQLERKQNEHR